MDYRPRILEALKHSSSKEPMSIDVLQVVLGVGKATIQPALDAMYNQVPAAINRALITRGGIEKAHYWPTGVVQSFKGDHAAALAHAKTWSVSSKRPALPPRRTEQQTASPVTQKGEQVKNEKKVSNVDVVKYVISNPGATNNQVLDHFVGDDQPKRKDLGVMICNCLTNNYLKRQEDKSLVMGDNKIWLAQHDLLDAKKNSQQGGVASSHSERVGKPLAQSKEPEGMDAAGPGGNAENGPKAGSKPEEPAAQPSSELEPFNPKLEVRIEVPAFLKKENAKPLVEMLQEHSEAIVKKEPASPFRVSVSSDRILTIYGKTAEPIELNAEEAEQLRDFMDGVSMLFPVPISTSHL